MSIARRPTTVLDCPDAGALATFYAAMLGWQVKGEDGWSEAWSEDWPPLAFQEVEGYRAPTWPSQDVPQQHHIDVVVDDLDEAEVAVVALGATKAEHQPGTTFRVFLDPAGHPFCLCTS
ncbi:MAG: VOC family protein [Actinomycetota bacterium]|nr:VOC family protein [Actinomycetota bacterium]